MQIRATPPPLGRLGQTGLFRLHGDQLPGRQQRDKNFLCDMGRECCGILVEVDEGSGFVTHEDNYDEFGYTFTTTNLSVVVRVTPYNGSGTLQSSQAQTASYTLPAAPANLTLSTAVGTAGILVSWDEVSIADDYEIGIYVDGTAMGDERTSSRSHRVYASEIQAMLGASDTPPWHKTLLVKVRANKGNDCSTWATASMALAVPTNCGFIEATDIVSPDLTFTWKNLQGSSNSTYGCPDGFIVVFRARLRKPRDRKPMGLC